MFYSHSQAHRGKKEIQKYNTCQPNTKMCFSDQKFKTDVAVNIIRDTERARARERQKDRQVDRQRDCGIKKKSVSFLCVILLPMWQCAYREGKLAKKHT